jgi:hypothetical protein
MSSMAPNNYGYEKTQIRKRTTLKFLTGRCPRINCLRKSSYACKNRKEPTIMKNYETVLDAFTDLKEQGLTYYFYRDDHNLLLVFFTNVRCLILGAG